MKVSAICTKTIYHSASGKLYDAGKVYSLVPTPDLSNYFSFEPELRNRLREELAAAQGKAPTNPIKTAERDAKALAELAHQPKATEPAHPTTLHAITAQPKNLPTDKPMALSELTAAPVQGVNFLD